MMDSRLGHSVGSLLTMDATATLGGFEANPIVISVVSGERKKGMKGISASVASSHSNVFSFGRKGLLAVRSCRARKTSGATSSLKSTLSFCTLRALFWKTIYSAFVGTLSKDLQNKSLSEEKTGVVK